MQPRNVWPSERVSDLNDCGRIAAEGPATPATKVTLERQEMHFSNISQPDAMLTSTFMTLTVAA